MEEQLRMSGRGAPRRDSAKIASPVMNRRMERADDNWQVHSPQEVQRWFDKHDHAIRKTKEDLAQLPLWLANKVRVQQWRV